MPEQIFTRSMKLQEHLIGKLFGGENVPRLLRDTILLLRFLLEKGRKLLFQIFFLFGQPVSLGIQLVTFYAEKPDVRPSARADRA